jgi:N-acetyl-gamma-glutamyl-phosphate/LysW-gamma-L-alpha-aminoadipyl-6-phosphate reductase
MGEGIGMIMRVSIAGGSGYIGGELLRLLAFHPEVELAQASSRGLRGQHVGAAHPNLRGYMDLRFCDPGDLCPCDVLFLALPHGEAAERIEQYAALAPHLIDCSADFRLHDPGDYTRWYGWEHPAPDWLEHFVYGLPERHREPLRGAPMASGVGCNATLINLALGPLADAGWLEGVTGEVKVGSSEGGTQHNPGSHHPERSGVVRLYSPSGHRHLAEVQQELGDIPLRIAMTAVDLVRGAHLTAHCFLQPGAPVATARDIWNLYRDAYREEPFVRLVASQRGGYRFPEPKILAGTNLCEIGLHFDPDSKALVMVSALDNLMKGGAGTAVQVMNLMLGLDERAGLGFPGLHPI